MTILVTRRIKVLSVFKAKVRTNTWQKHEFKCSCGCVFKLNVGDEPLIFARLEEINGGVTGFSDWLVYFVYCPGGCGATLQVGSSLPRPNDYKLALPRHF